MRGLLFAASGGPPIMRPTQARTEVGPRMSLLPYLHEPSRILRKVRWSLMQSRQDCVELTAETWNGRLTFNSGDRLISKFLYVRRAYEQHYVTQVIEYLDRARLRSTQRDVV